MSRRAFVVVLDAAGAGALPDAAAYGDEDADTLVHVAEAEGGLQLPVLGGLGLGRIRPLPGVPPALRPALHGRLHPLGPGKDSTVGHWELMGVVAPEPLPTYPGGFPEDVVARLRAATGRAFCGNRPADGMAVLEDLGAHHLRTGDVILYTSADSVLQLAAHDDVLSEPDLLAACAAARAVMTGEHAVGRVIARPFTGRPGAFTRTTGRKDFSVQPSGPVVPRRAPARPASPSTRSARSTTSSPASASTRRTSARRTRRRSRRPGAWSTSSTPGSCSRTSSRPTSSTAIATTPPASPAR